MAGALLNSGSLQQYTAIGDEGQPVYSVAAQLREAVRLKVGAAAANCLAIPRVNEARSVIDWYSPVDGMVVPWSAATEQERSDALRDLDQFEQEMTQAIGKLGGVSDREKRIVQNLLAKVFHFPGHDCVFLVDGRPVLTFWGFQDSRAQPVRDPFHTLRPVAPAVPPPLPQHESAVQDTPGARPWWLWLLLLVLLALLLFWLLRSCVQQPAVLQEPAPVNVTQEPAVSDPKPEVRPEVRPEADPAVVQGARTVEGRVVGQDTTVGVVGETGDVSATAGQDGSTEGLVPVDPPAIDPGLVDSALDAVGEVPGEVPAEVPPEALDPALQDGEGTEATEATEGIEGTDGNETAAATGEPDSSGDTATTGSGSESGAVPGTDPASGATNAPGNPLAIPPDALQSGSVQFLDGNWRAAGGIQDSQTGKPVRMQYQFEDGQAKVTVDRGNGVQCEGAANSSIVNGRLQISEQGTVAKCSDGSSFAIPQLSCTPDQSGRSQCSGQTPDGRAFPITIRQMP